MTTPPTPLLMKHKTWPSFTFYHYKLPIQIFSVHILPMSVHIFPLLIYIIKQKMVMPLASDDFKEGFGLGFEVLHVLISQG